jgi:hypothetical protein
MANYPKKMTDPTEAALSAIQEALRGASSDADREPASQLRLPTLDERVSLYSQAVREEHDLRGESSSNVRDRILDAMAADITNRVGIDLPERDRPRIPQVANPNELGLPQFIQAQDHYGSEDVALCASLESHSADHARTALGRAHVADRFDFKVDPAFAQEILSRRQPARTLRRLAAISVSICAAAVIAGAVTFSPSRDFQPIAQWFGVAPKSGKLDLAVQSLQKPSEPQLQTRQNEPTPWASVGTSAVMSPSARQVELQPLSTNKPTPEEIADLVKRGRELVAAGKIRDARILLKRAAEAGDASAALALATTFDPAELEKLGARDADPDIAIARAWYQKAKDLAPTPDRRFPQNSDR